MDDKHDTLARLPIFARLAPRSMDAVSTLARMVSAPAGTVLMQEGDASDSFFVIASGTVRIEREGRFIRSMNEGGFLGEIGLLEDRDRTATATCATDCEVIEFGSFEFSRVMATFPDVRFRVEAAAARRPHVTDE